MPIIMPLRLCSRDFADIMSFHLHSTLVWYIILPLLIDKSKRFLKGKANGGYVIYIYILLFLAELFMNIVKNPKSSRGSWGGSVN